MNRCELIQDDLKAYLDGQLPLLERQRVRQHLKGCATCREELSAMERISKRLRADGPKPLEPSLREKILAAAYELGSQAQDSSKTAPKWRRKPVLIWAATATALIAWFALYPILHNQVEQRRAFAQNSIDAETPMAAGTPAPMNARAVAANAAPKPLTQSVASPQEMQRTEMMATRKSMSFKSFQGQVNEAMAPRLHKNMQNYDEEPASSQVAQAPTNISGGGRPQTPSAGAMDYYQLNDGHAKQIAHAPTRRAMNPAGMDVNGNYLQDKSRPISNTRLPASSANKGSAGETEAAGEDERVVHHEAEITVQVDNVEAKSEAVEQIAQGAGGFVANNQLSTGDDNQKTASLTLKVPAGQFQNVLNQVARQGEVKAKNITGEDLTEQISDQEQAEQVLRQDIRSTQEQLNQRLSRAGREERLDILRDLRIKAAQAQAHLKLLRKLGTLSTISVELDEKPHKAAPAPKTGGFVSEMNDTLHDAVHSMMQAARLPVLTFIWILAYSPLLILLIMGYRWAVRR